VALGLLNGCDSVTRHRVLTTVFDGVPDYPEPVQLCDEYYVQRLAAEAAGETLDEQAAGKGNAQRSSHQPYAEKACDDCHSGDKSVGGGLIAPKQELCFVCHKDFIPQQVNVHGPVAVGDCLACHLPHSSPNKSLLVESPEKICTICHQEQRLAAAMHQRFIAKEIGCGECHDPHFGEARYFLK
jgi:predicted CXXCH cytochrome family protein